MATGLEVIGAIASSIELVKAAKTCMTVFRDLQHGSVLAREQKELHFRVVAQGLKFERWCIALGIQGIIQLEETDSRWQQTKDFVRFEEILRSELRFKNPDIARLTIDIMKSMNQKFAEATRIFSKYSEQKQIAAPDSNKRRLNRRWSRFSSKGNLDVPAKKGFFVEQDNDSRGSSTTSLSSTARWLSTDKSTINQLLSSIEALNDSLMSLLQSSLQKQVSRTTTMTILETADYHTLAMVQSFPDENELKPLASMKRWQMREQKNDGENISSNRSVTIPANESSSTRVYTYPVQDFKRGTLRIGDSRTLSLLDGQPVVVEWKYFSKEHPFRIEQSVRLTSLVGILNRNNLFNKFLALPCKGLVSDTENSRVGIVFATGEPNTTVMGTLQTVIGATQTPPPIGERFNLARRFSLCLSYLHSVKWLHKSIRSDNLICFQPGTTKDPKEHLRKSIVDLESEADIVAQDPNSITSNMESLAGPPNPLPDFYLLGWDLSRPDHPSELSETLSISTLGFQAKRDVIQMYSHPEASPGLNTANRSQYRAQFDIYSMGLVLLEIGLWRTISTIRLRCKDDHDFRLRVRTEYCDKLQSKMGLIYWRAVQRCLNNDFDIEKEDVSGESDFQLAVAFEKHVISELEKCCA